MSQWWASQVSIIRKLHIYSSSFIYNIYLSHLIESQMGTKRKRTQTNQENFLRSIETLKMIWLIEMKMEDWNLCILMEQLLMLESQVWLFFLVVPSVFLQTDLLERFMYHQDVVNFLSWVLCNSSQMSFSKRRIIKRSKRVYSVGCCKTKAIWKLILRMSLSWVNIIMFQT